MLPEALLNYLALLGWSPGDDREIFSADELCKAFRLDQVSKSPAEFNYEKLYWLNRHYLKQADRGQVVKLAAAYFPQAAHAPDWLAAVVDLLLPSVDYLQQLPERAEVVFKYDAGTIQADAESRAVLEEPESGRVLAAFIPRALTPGDLAPRFKELMNEVKKETGVKGKHLFHPVRVALTGRPSGPELDKLLPLLEQGAALDLVKGPHKRLEEFRLKCPLS